MKKSQRVAGTSKDLYRRTACLAPEVALRIYSQTNSPFSMRLAANLVASNFSEIVSATVNPMDYTNAGTFGRDYLCAELMSKYPEWDLGIDRAEVALAKFSQAETQCRSTNELFLQSIGASTVGGPAHPVLLTAARKISRLLGKFSWPDVFATASWGPGATTRLSRARRDAYYKFGGIPHATHDLYPIAAKMVKSVPGWHIPAIEVVSGNKVTTVPKNAKTDRSIAIEPDLNMVIQKGIGKLLRKRLQRVGLLLPDAQERNNALAQLGSLTGEYATIDLSSASDTVSYELVRSLLPPRWFEALEQSRSPSGVLPSGEQVEYQKFSSMGNGYTFELETLIFWALASSVIDEGQRGMDRRLLVFGDDIIVPTYAVGRVLEVLEMCGFTPNMKKTFYTGPFRESCGKHYFQGTDVTPFYIRSSVNDINRRYWLANTIKRWSRLSYGLDPTYKEVYDLVVDKIPKKWRLPIPDGYGDGGLVVDFDEATPSRAPKGYEGFQFRYVSEVTPKLAKSDTPYLLKALYTLEGLGVERDVDNRIPGTDFKYKVSNGLTPQWSHFGPWL